MTKTHRSRFWIVSTHVLTTGFVWPLLANVAAFAAILGLGLQLIPALILTFALIAMGYLGGAYYSLAYLRKAASSDHWSACTIPSIATFVFLSIVGLAVNMYRFPASPGLILGLILFYFVIIAVFSLITWRGFATLDGRVLSAGRPYRSAARVVIAGGWECSRCGNMNHRGERVCATCRLQT